LAEGVFDSVPSEIVVQVRTQLAGPLASQRLQSQIAAGFSRSSRMPLSADVQAVLVAAVSELVQQFAPAAASGTASSANTP
jgi:F-type H+-transporting ATPase subunit alpha